MIRVMKIERIKKSFAAHGIECYEDMMEHEFLPGLQPYIVCKVYNSRRNVTVVLEFPKDCYTYAYVYRYMKDEGYLHRSRLGVKVE